MQTELIAIVEKDILHTLMTEYIVTCCYVTPAKQTTGRTAQAVPCIADAQLAGILSSLVQVLSSCTFGKGQLINHNPLDNHY